MFVRQGSKGWPAGWCEDIPKVFSSLEEARNSLDYLWCVTTTWFEEFEASKGNLEGRHGSREALCKRYHEWTMALNGFLGGSKPIGFMAAKGVTCLRIIQRTAEILLGKFAAEAPFAEITWDRFLDDHREVLRLAESVLEPCPSIPNSARMQPDFSLDMSLVAPLYLIASRCRDPETRRRAISLLYSLQRVEGIWSSVVAARVAERFLALEEAGLGYITQPSDVPEETRIALLSATFVAATRSLTICYARQGSINDCTQEVFEW